MRPTGGPIQNAEFWEEIDEEANFDPCAEGGGDPCAVCGVKQDPWRYRCPSCGSKDYEG